jgi:hypothetical protein
MNDTTDLVSQLQSMAEDPKTEDAPVEDGTNDAGPDTGGGQLVTLEMSEKEIGEWWKEIERAKARRTSREDSWDLLLDEYMPVVTKSGVAETVKVQAHFRNVQTRIGSLFYRSPDVTLMPDDPGPANNVFPTVPQAPGMAPAQPPKTMGDVIAIKQAVLKKKLGRDGIKANRLMDELLFDVLAWAGLGGYKIGYKATFKTVSKPKMQPGPAQPSMLGLAPAPQVPVLDPVTQQPMMEDVDVPVHEEYYARRISPKKLLWDSQLKSVRFREDAAWVGHEFFISKKRAMKEFGLTDEEASKATQDERYHKYQGDDQTAGVGLVHGYELFLRANLYTDEVHPEAICQLILIEGIKDRPVVWRPSVDQEFDEATGRLTQDSLLGFPLGFLTIRDLADSCFPPSDSAFTNSDIKQMSTYRRQTIRLRDAAIGKYLFDPTAFDETDVDLLKNGDIGEFIAVQDGKLKDGPDKIFTPTTKLQGSADDQRGFMGIKQDMNETLGVGSNASGVETDTVRTATEADKVASAMQARNDKEESRVIDVFLDIARGIDQLLMRYMTDTEYVEIAGEEAGAAMRAWNGKLITGKYLYDVAPDSQKRPDMAKDRADTLQYYNLTAKDPMSNRQYILKKLARQFGNDPAKAVVMPPPPPPPVPEPPKITFSFTADDLDDPRVITLVQVLTGGPQGAAVTLGITGHQAQPEHGGPNEPGDVISQHLQSNSGGKENAPGASNHRESQVK